MAIYEPGEQVPIHTDLFPAQISPRPPEVPGGVKIRVVVTERAITIMWPAPAGGVGRHDIEMSPEQTQNATFAGGQVGEFLVSRAGGCGCGGKAVKAAVPFEGVIFTQAPRVKSAPRTTGVPPSRYTRVRTSTG